MVHNLRTLGSTTATAVFLFVLISCSFGDDLQVPSLRYPTIQSALSNAESGDVICVAAGTYFPKKTLVVQQNELTIRGAVNEVGNPATIIDGDDKIGIFRCETVKGEAKSARGWLVFENLVIQRGRASVGSGINNGGRKLNAENVIFTKNDGGGIRNVECEHIQLRDCEFNENKASGNQKLGGAGASNIRCNLIELQGCRFYGNQIGGDGLRGGGMMNEESQLTVINCEFEENESGSEGTGGLAMYNKSSSLVLKRCRFLNNVSSLEKAGIYNEETSLYLADCFFQGNYGAIYSEPDASMKEQSFTVHLLRCVFEENITGTRGGAINHIGGELIVETCLFGGNNATAEGGAIICQECTMEIDDCTFTENITGYQSWIGNSFSDAKGGAIYAKNLLSGTISNSVFNQNKATGYTEPGSGGAVYISETHDLNMTLCRFEENEAAGRMNSNLGPGKSEQGGPGFGGALYCDESDPTVTDCSFLSNVAAGSGGFGGFGGELYASHSAPALFSCEFRNNRAAAIAANRLEIGGGAIYNKNSFPLLEACVIENNYALGTMPNDQDQSGYGGGIFNETTVAEIVGCCIRRNTSGSANETENRGGGIFNDTNSGFTTVENSVVCGNWRGQIAGFYTDRGGNLISDQCDCHPSDINCDGNVDGADLTILLGYWGTENTRADLNFDGIVDGADLTILLGDWGDCGGP